MRLWPLNYMFLTCSFEFMLSLPIKGGLHSLPVTLKDTSLLVLLTESLWPFTNASCPPTCMCFSLRGTSQTCWDFIYTLYYSYRGLKVWHQRETTEIIAANINTTGLSESRPHSNKSNRYAHFEMLIMSFKWGFCEILRNVCASVFRFYVTWTRSEPTSQTQRDGRRLAETDMGWGALCIHVINCFPFLFGRRFLYIRLQNSVSSLCCSVTETLDDDEESLVSTANLWVLCWRWDKTWVILRHLFIFFYYFTTLKTKWGIMQESNHQIRQ